MKLTPESQRTVDEDDGDVDGGGHPPQSPSVRRATPLEIDEPRFSRGRHGGDGSVWSVRRRTH